MQCPRSIVRLLAAFEGLKEPPGGLKSQSRRKAHENYSR
jgi:hypothetical protein